MPAAGLMDPETYSEMLRSWKEENYDLLLDGARANLVKTAAKAKEEVCNETNIKVKGVC